MVELKKLEVVEKIDHEVQEGGKLCSHLTRGGYGYAVFTDASYCQVLTPATTVTDSYNQYHVGCEDSPATYKLKGGTYVLQYYVLQNPNGTWSWKFEWGAKTTKADEELIQMIVTNPRRVSEWVGYWKKFSELSKEELKHLIREALEPLYCAESLLTKYKFRRKNNNILEWRDEWRDTEECWIKFEDLINENLLFAISPRGAVIRREITRLYAFHKENLVRFLMEKAPLGRI